MRALLARSRYLDDAHFRVPIDVYRQYLRDQLGEPAAPRSTAPVPMIAEDGSYLLTVAKDRSAALQATVRLRIFDPAKSANLPVLTAALAWEKLTIDGKDAKLATVDNYLRFAPDKEGLYVIAAEVPLKTAGPDGGAVVLAIPRTVRTLARFDSPGDWEVLLAGDDRRIVPVAGKGTAGQVAVTPRDKLELTYRRPQPLPEHPPRYELNGAVAWNLDAACQQVSASLTVAIAGGESDRVNLTLPGSADRVSVAGPDVRETQFAGGEARVFLRGRIRGRTALSVSYEMPLGKAGLHEFGVLGVREGHWSGGTLVVTNSAGGSELLPGSITGLKEMALADIPSSASSILPAPAMLAYEIAAREWSASVEQVFLGEFALRESIADLAHYELFFSDDGSVFCRASYEVRNRNRQFLRLDLPPGSRVLLARVNEKSQPLSPAPGLGDAWLLPLVRSLPSVKGLVSFPVEIVIAARTGGLKGQGVAEIPLPVVDLPIAYAWCQAYMPEGLKVRQWSGPLKRVDSFSSETARASLDYGRGELAEGYTEKARPTVAAVAELDRPPAKPETPAKPEAGAKPEPPRVTLGFGWMQKQLAPSGGVEPQPSGKPFGKSGFDENTTLLARNYYRAGKDYYDRGDYSNASRALEQVQNLAPGSVEATNSLRLLDNVRLVQGKLELRSQSEKVAGLEVQREVSRLNRKLEEQQQQYVEQGLQAARAGDVEQAKTKFKAAESLGRQIVSQGGQQKEVSARFRSAQGEMEKVQKQEQAQVRQLREQVKTLKESGRYEEALNVAKNLRDLQTTADVNVDGDLDLRKDLEDLAIRANKEKQFDQQLANAKEEVRRLRTQVRELGAKGNKQADFYAQTQDDYLQELDDWAAGKVHYYAPPTKESMLSRLQGQAQHLSMGLQEGRPKGGQADIVTGATSEGMPWSYYTRAAPSTQPALTQDLYARRQAQAAVRGYFDSVLQPPAERAAPTPPDSGIVSRIEHARDVRSPPADVDFEKALTASYDSLSAARSADDFKKAEAAAMLARDALDAGKSLYAASDYNEKLAKVNDQIRWLHQKRDQWETVQVATLRAGGGAGGTGVVTRSYAVGKADPDKLATTLNQVFSTPTPTGGGRAMGASGGGGAGTIRVAADGRIITVRASEETQAKIARMIEEMDQPTGLSETSRNLYVLKNADAEAVAARLRDSLDREQARLPSAGPRATIIADKSSNALILSGAAGDLEKISRLIEELDSAAQSRPDQPAQPVLGGIPVAGRLFTNRGRAVDEKDFASRADRFTRWGGPEPADRPSGEDRARIAELTGLAQEHMRRHDYPAALNALDQVRGIDPRNQWAREQRDMLEQFLVLDQRSQERIGGVARVQHRAEARASEVPWVDTLRYPRDWQELVERGGGGGGGPGRGGQSGQGQTDGGFIYARDDRAQATGTVTKVYDIRDLIARVPAFEQAAQQAQEKEQLQQEGPKTSDEEQAVRGIKGAITGNVDPQSWKGDNTLLVSNGRLIVRQTAENQKAIEDLIAQVREAKGPQVQLGEKIAQQQAKGLNLTDGGTVNVGGTVVLSGQFGGTGGTVNAPVQTGVNASLTGGTNINTIGGNELREFISRNYSWANLGTNTFSGATNLGTNLPRGTTAVAAGTILTTDGTVQIARDTSGAMQYVTAGDANAAFTLNAFTLNAGTLAITQEELLRKLQFNRGQKVAVNSMNLNADAAAAESLGAAFAKGNNDVTYAVIDEAQFRTLMEIDARNSRAGQAVVDNNGRAQETIVGTDALLANDWTANVAFAGDRGNTLDVNGNGIILPHENYILINNGDYLTVVRAGEMKHWTQRDEGSLQFAEVPQTIEAPRLGHQFKLEKSLVKPTDRLVIRIEYTWEGASK